MSAPKFKNRLSLLVAAGLVAGMLLLGGCLEKTLVWSPDGKRAVVAMEDGIYLMDANGKLSERLSETGFRIAWLSNSQGFVLARGRSATEWAPIAAVLGAEKAAVLAAKAEAVDREVESGTKWDAVAKGGLHEVDGAVRIYLRERHAAALRSKLGEEWKNFESATQDIYSLVVAQLDGDRVTVGAQLCEGLGAIQEVRLAPGGRFVAFTAPMTMDSGDGQLGLVPLDGSAAAVVVAAHTSEYFDWSADGRSLVDFEAAGATSDTDTVRLAALAERTVVGPDGRVVANPTVNFLAGGLFNNSRVRCLRDGRILFNAVEMSLPVSTKDYGGQREQLFMLDRARQSTLVRVTPHAGDATLPQELTFFEVSPDERQVLFGSYKGAVGVLTLASGELEVIQQATGEDLQGAPVWRTADEFSYLRRNAPVDGKTPARKAEVVLRRGDKETVLSAGWPDAVMEKLIK